MDRAPHLGSVEVAGPGFVNLHLTPGWLYDTLAAVVGEGEQGYARNEIGADELVQIVTEGRTGDLALDLYAGVGLSVAGMIAAALGFITPVQGALFQEVIDVAVILNALRALYDPSKI